MIYYLTGTGNSRWAAQLLADHLHDTAEDAAPALKSGLAPSLHSEKPWVFVCPTYGWQIPHVFADLLRRTGFDGSRKAYFVLTCGDDIGAAGPRLRKLCGELGLEYRGVWPLVMPENYVAMFPVPGEEEAKKIIDAAREPLLEAAALIAGDQPFPGGKLTLADRLKSGIFPPKLTRCTPRSGSGACPGSFCRTQWRAAGSRRYRPCSGYNAPPSGVCPPASRCSW